MKHKCFSSGNVVYAADELSEFFIRHIFILFGRLNIAHMGNSNIVSILIFAVT